MTRHLAKDVLIVDDDRSTLSLIQTALCHSGLTCDTAADGVYALDHMSATEYTVVLLDLMMPRLDGAGLLREVRALPLVNGVRPIIIVLTASRNRDELFALSDLVQVVIRKPFDLETLTEIVQGCVSGRKVAMDSYRHAATMNFRQLGT